MAIPAPGDRILVVKPYWLELILSGQKTMEIRGVPYRAGKYFLGCNRQIRAIANLGTPERISTAERWIELRPRHRVMADDLPYKSTFGLPILTVQSVSAIPYTHPHGAVSVVKYRAR